MPNPKYDKTIIPEDVQQKLCEKYGISRYYLLSVYYAYWRAAIKITKKDVKRMEDIEEGTIKIPHIGKIKIKKKFYNYVRLQRRDAKIQPDNHDGEEV